MIRNTALEKFCEIVRKRSRDNKEAIELLFPSKMHGQTISILRQELDSMTRCIYLLHQNLFERSRLINMTLNGERWRYTNNKIITDSQMVDLAERLHGWTSSVYKFGCGFIHLSNYHDPERHDPFADLEEQERQNIKQFMNGYHNYNLNEELTFQSVKPYLYKVFIKIYDNLKYYVKDLEENKNYAQ